MKRSRVRVMGIDVELLEFDEGVETVERAARASGEPPEVIVKTLLMRAGDEYIVVLARGLAKVNTEALSKALGTPVVLARAREVRAVLGVEPGAVTPLSEKVKALRIFADPGILHYEYVLVGGGSTRSLIRVRTSDLVRALSPSFVGDLLLKEPETHDENKGEPGQSQQHVVSG